MQIEIKTQRITREWKPCANNQSSSRGVVDRVFQKVVTKVEYAHLSEYSYLTGVVLGEKTC